MNVSELISKCDATVTGPQAWSFEVIDGVAWFFFGPSWGFWEWARNFLCIPVPWRGRWAHLGYVLEFEHIRAELMDKVAEVRRTGIRDTIFSGYLQGVAIAKLAQYYFGGRLVIAVLRYPSCATTHVQRCRLCPLHMRQCWIRCRHKRR